MSRQFFGQQDSIGAPETLTPIDVEAKRLLYPSYPQQDWVYELLNVNVKTFLYSPYNVYLHRIKDKWFAAVDPILNKHPNLEQFKSGFEELCDAKTFIQAMYKEKQNGKNIES